MLEITQEKALDRKAADHEKWSVQRSSQSQGVTHMPKEARVMEEPVAMSSRDDMSTVGHLYMQTNEVRNCVIHYARAGDGTLTEEGRCLTGGAGSGTFKPISGQESAPNAFEGARSVITTPDRRFLFATNGGDNSVSSFEIGVDGKLTLIDVRRTGNVVGGRSGTCKSLAYSPVHHMLFVLHGFGPEHVRLMTVDGDGQLRALPDSYTINTMDKPNRVATMVTLSPDERFLLVGTTFDEPAETNPDGSPILWVRRDDGNLHVIASNAPDPDGLVVFPVDAYGRLGEAVFQDGGGGSPFFPVFLNHRPDQFAIGYAVADGVSLANLDDDGTIRTTPVATIDTSRGKPSELCWLSISPDDRWIFATNFGYSYISTFRIEGNVLTVAHDKACPRVAGDGTFRALNGTVSSGPSDSWVSPDGRHLYQIYGNASKLIGYAVQADGSLTQVTACTIPYNSPQGLTGF
jgi:6-phosphogluconolactonase (cycloisomerase 2 family)